MSGVITQFPTPVANRRLADVDGTSGLRQRADCVANVAAAHADVVDAEARFPAEAIQALRDQRLLGMMIPASLGGDGARAADVADVCYALGRACASTALIFAMHQTMVACLVRHARGAPWQEALQRRIAQGQWLVASSTTEGGGGGDVRSSEAAIQRSERGISLQRDASVISYGAHADAIVTTARRAQSAEASDQVLVAFAKADYALEPTSSWDTLGMRGTCSRGFILRAAGQEEQILADPYERIHGRTMTAYSHVFWSAAWSGVAAGSVTRARAFVRKASRGAGGKTPPAAAHLTRARLSLESLRGVVQAGVRQLERNARQPDAAPTIEAQLAITLLKVQASELALATVMSAMRTCGLAGYRSDGEFAMGRFLRDILSAPIMINNDRILANAEGAVMITEASPLLSGL